MEHFDDMFSSLLLPDPLIVPPNMMTEMKTSPGPALSLIAAETLISHIRARAGCHIFHAWNAADVPHRDSQRI